MNTHFSLRTDGPYLKKIPNEPAYQFIKLFIEEQGNEQANNYLLMGTVSGDLKNALLAVKESKNGNDARISFHIDDNDDTEIYWYAPDDWHCMITVHNEGKSIIYTRTHPKHKRMSVEYVFHPFSV